jgi:hypothetical protein
MTGVMSDMPKPTVPEVLPIVHAYIAKVGNAAGSLHIVLDDGNYSDDNVRFCIQWAMDHGDDDGVALGKLLLRMSRTQRRKIARQAYRGGQ